MGLLDFLFDDRTNVPRDAGAQGGLLSAAAPIRPAGLLGTSWEDPRTAASLNAAISLLTPTTRRRGVMEGLAQAMGAYQSTVSEGRRQQEAGQFRQWQQQMAMQQAQRQVEQHKRQQEFLANLPSPQMQASQQALAGGGGPTMANAAAIPKVDPLQAQLLEAVRAGVIPYDAYVAATRRDNTPKYTTVAPGGTVFDERAGKPVYTAPKERELPSEVREFEYARDQGYGGTFAQFKLEGKRASAPSVTVNTEKGYGERIATGLADRDLSAIDAARAAPDMIASAQRIQAILANQKPITGTGADARLVLAKALQTAGLTQGGDVVATENLQRELSQATLNAIKSSGLGSGQGFSNADRDFLSKAAAGTIQVNAETLAKTAELNERAARRSIEVGNAALKRVRSAPGMGTLPFGPDISQPSGNVVDFGSLK